MNMIQNPVIPGFHPDPAFAGLMTFIILEISPALSIFLDYSFYQ